MKLFPFCFGLLLAAFSTTTLSAQYKLTPNQLADIPLAVMPLQDNDALLAAELAARKPGRANTFGVSLPAKIRPTNSGIWTTEAGREVWRQRIQSPGAKTLNLGFSEFVLPVGAELYLLTPDEKLGPFTPADNDDHQQLWTPIVAGDELIVELRVPKSNKDLVRLYLTNVNHDFEGVSKSLSQSCNLDVVCGDADGWPIVDKYRDIIRSVAAYTLNGIDQCTGFLVNNVNNDGKPFFMTANHCSVTASSGPAVVAYWNFQNSFCRDVVDGSTTQTPGSNGRRNIFNSGTTHLASFPDADATITLLDDPVPDAANAFYAGWSAEAAVPTDTVICIHHPGVDEKRISFSFQQVFRTFSRGGGSPNPDGNHIEVPDWDIGTTEGGSSGSPIFDRFGRVRGQLFGGGASCNNDAYDVYGYFHSSWTGGGTLESRLMDWLDPCGTGTLTMDGFDSAQLPTTLVTDVNCKNACNSLDNTFVIRLGNGFPANSPVTITSSTAGISPTLSTSTASGGQTVTLTVPGDAGIAEGMYEIVVTAGSGANTDDITLSLELFSGEAAAPSGPSPANGVSDVSPTTSLSWSAIADVLGYDYDLSTNADFSTIVSSGRNLSETIANPINNLSPNTTYFWRVRSINNCGSGEWATFSFTTNNQACAEEISENTPVTISTNGTPTAVATIDIDSDVEIDALEVSVDIAHSFIGDIEGVLVAPDGTNIRLFNAVANGNCAGDDISVVFSMSAIATAEDFEDGCSADIPAITGTFQPAESFAPLANTSSAGTWSLRVSDNANLDGGEITNFALLFCGTGEIVDFSINSQVNDLASCQNEQSTVILTLGASFTDAVTLAAATESGAINADDFNFSFDAPSRQLTANFTDWSGLAPGNYNLTLTVSEGDTERDIMLPLRINPFADPAVLTSPEDGAMLEIGEVVFNWDLANNANNYTLQYSFTEDFATIEFEQISIRSILTLDNLPTGRPLYWRIISNDNCGNAISAVRSVTVGPTSIQDFGQGRILSVYPNPVKQFVSVQATGNWSGNTEARLFNTRGQLLSQYTLTGSGSYQWDLGVLPAGVYYLRFEGLGVRHTERLVVLP